jgi:hypothetical protein
MTVAHDGRADRQKGTIRIGSCLGACGH